MLTVAFLLECHGDVVILCCYFYPVGEILCCSLRLFRESYYVPKPLFAGIDTACSFIFLFLFPIFTLATALHPINPWVESTESREDLQMQWHFIRFLHES